MTKSDLMNRFSEKYPFLNIRNVERIVNIVFEQITQALENGERVEIRGFGSFSVHVRDGCTGRNPKTGEPVFIKRRRVPFFKAGKHLKDSINGKLDFSEGI